MADVREVLRDYILGVAHVGFVVPDMAAALDNARRVYGLQEADIRYVPETGEDAATLFAFFTVGNLEFELIEPRSDYFREILLAMPSGGAGINHVAWRVVDIDGAVAGLAERGIHPGYVTPGGIVAIGSNKMVYLDPATTGGLLIELIEKRSGAPSDG